MQYDTGMQGLADNFSTGQANWSRNEGDTFRRPQPPNFQASGCNESSAQYVSISQVRNPANGFDGARLDAAPMPGQMDPPGQSSACYEQGQVHLPSAQKLLQTAQLVEQNLNRLRQHTLKMENGHQEDFGFDPFGDRGPNAINLSDPSPNTYTDCIDQFDSILRELKISKDSNAQNTGYVNPSSWTNSQSRFEDLMSDIANASEQRWIGELEVLRAQLPNPVRSTASFQTPSWDQHYSDPDLQEGLKRQCTSGAEFDEETDPNNPVVQSLYKNLQERYHLAQELHDRTQTHVAESIPQNLQKGKDLDNKQSERIMSILTTDLFLTDENQSSPLDYLSHQRRSVMDIMTILDMSVQQLSEWQNPYKLMVKGLANLGPESMFISDEVQERIDQILGSRQQQMKELKSICLGTEDALVSMYVLLHQYSTAQERVVQSRSRFMAHTGFSGPAHPQPSQDPARAEDTELDPYPGEWITYQQQLDRIRKQASNRKEGILCELLGARNFDSLVKLIEQNKRIVIENKDTLETEISRWLIELAKVQSDNNLKDLVTLSKIHGVSHNLIRTFQYTMIKRFNQMESEPEDQHTARDSFWDNVNTFLKANMWPIWSVNDQSLPSNYESTIELDVRITNPDTRAQWAENFDVLAMMRKQCVAAEKELNLEAKIPAKTEEEETGLQTKLNVSKTLLTLMQNILDEFDNPDYQPFTEPLSAPLGPNHQESEGESDQKFMEGCIDKFLEDNFLEAPAYSDEDMRRLMYKAIKRCFEKDGNQYKIGVFGNVTYEGMPSMEKFYSTLHALKDNNDTIYSLLVLCNVVFCWYDSEEEEVEPLLNLMLETMKEICAYVTKKQNSHIPFHLHGLCFLADEKSNINLFKNSFAEQFKIFHENNSIRNEFWTWILKWFGAYISEEKAQKIQSQQNKSNANSLFAGHCEPYAYANLKLQLFLYFQKLEFGSQLSPPEIEKANNSELFARLVDWPGQTSQTELDIQSLIDTLGLIHDVVPVNNAPQQLYRAGNFEDLKHEDLITAVKQAYWLLVQFTTLKKHNPQIIDSNLGQWQKFVQHTQSFHFSNDDARKEIEAQEARSEAAAEALDGALMQVFGCADPLNLALYENIKASVQLMREKWSGDGRIEKNEIKHHLEFYAVLQVLPTLCGLALRILFYRCRRFKSVTDTLKNHREKWYDGKARPEDNDFSLLLEEIINVALHMLEFSGEKVECVTLEQSRVPKIIQGTDAGVGHSQAEEKNAILSNRQMNLWTIKTLGRLGSLAWLPMSVKKLIERILMDDAAPPTMNFADAVLPLFDANGLVRSVLDQMYIVTLAQQVLTDLMDKHPHLRHPQMTMDLMYEKNRNDFFNDFVQLINAHEQLTRRFSGTKVTYARDSNVIAGNYRVKCFVFKHAEIVELGSGQEKQTYLLDRRVPRRDRGPVRKALSCNNCEIIVRGKLMAALKQHETQTREERNTAEKHVKEVNEMKQKLEKYSIEAKTEEAKLKILRSGFHQNLITELNKQNSSPDDIELLELANKAGQGDLILELLQSEAAIKKGMITSKKTSLEKRIADVRKFGLLQRPLDTETREKLKIELEELKTERSELSAQIKKLHTDLLDLKRKVKDTGNHSEYLAVVSAKRASMKDLAATLEQHIALLTAKLTM